VKKNSSLFPSFTVIKSHWQIVVIIMIATLLRTWQLDSKAILFGDAAHDLLVAVESVKQGQVPLLGIASSVPRFKQGPLTVWLEMTLSLVAGDHLLVYSLVFAVISLAAVVGVYEYGAIYLDKKTALVSALLVATSPLAVAHGRVVYHITPIPLMMVLYWFALQSLWQAKPRSLFWAVLAWCGLFQFELALLPAVLAIPYVWWRTKQKFNRSWVLQIGSALILGLLPQILFDLTHRFAQLGGFGVWVGYRLVSATGLIGDQALSPGKFGQTLSLLWLYLGRIVSTDQVWLKGIVLVVLTWVLVKLIRQWRKKTLPPAIEIVVVVTGLLIGSFMIHASPSEAYFPPFIVCLPLILAYGLTHLQKFQKTALMGLVILAVFNSYQIIRHNFFVSNTQAFSYGLAVADQREVVMVVNRASQGAFKLATTQPGGVFPSYFDNLRWLAREQDLTETDDGQLFYIESKTSELSSYPGMKKHSLPLVDIYQIPSL
jgi:4-amino-4-deoxy-L-arabinose transferase-like glycosyltransferase